MKKPAPKPTAAELDILRILWTRGPSTVREVHESLSDRKETGYTGTLKLLQIMTAKGMVRRDEAQRAHIYEAVRPAEHTKRQVVTDVLHRVFEGSASQLLMHALSGRKTSRNELDELRKILDSHGDDGEDRTG